MKDMRSERREMGEQRQQTFRRHEWEERGWLQKYERTITVFWNGPPIEGKSKMFKSR